MMTTDQIADLGLRAGRLQHDLATAKTELARLTATVAGVRAVLERYNQAADGELPACAPEDRWRLYRDLTRVLEGIA